MKRRQFLGAAAATAGAASIPARAAVMRQVTWVYDPAVLKGVGPTDLFPPGSAPVAIGGDRVRFATRLLSDRPHELRGVTRYADYLILSGAAAEAGYRVVSRTPLDGGSTLSWAVRRK